MRLNEKIYPKGVVLRKQLVWVGILLLFIILVIGLSEFIHNLHSPINNHNPEQDNSVKTIDNDERSHWYQELSVQKPFPSTNTINPVTPKQISPNSSINSIVAPTPVTSTSSMDAETQKAMQAPITDNQLTGQNPSIATNIPPASSINNGLPIVNNAATPQNNNEDPNMQAEKNSFVANNSTPAANADYLQTTLQQPQSPFELQAGTIIPGILITGINSDLPGQITAQIRENVYDTISGQYLLIPQGAKLTGLYDSQITYGQERVLVVWNRIIFPNGQSIDLEGMPGVDISGYSGFNDVVDNHYTKIFGSVILMSVLSAGAQLSQPQQSNNPFSAPTVNQTLAQSLGTNIANVGTAILSKNLNIQPTLIIRPGYCFNISVTKDIVFPGIYSSEVNFAN